MAPGRRCGWPRVGIGRSGSAHRRRPRRASAPAKPVARRGLTTKTPGATVRAPRRRASASVAGPSRPATIHAELDDAPSGSTRGARWNAAPVPRRPGRRARRRRHGDQPVAALHETAPLAQVSSRPARRGEGALVRAAGARGADTPAEALDQRPVRERRRIAPLERAGRREVEGTEIELVVWERRAAALVQFAYHPRWAWSTRLRSLVSSTTTGSPWLVAPAYTRPGSRTERQPRSSSTAITTSPVVALRRTYSTCIRPDARVADGAAERKRHELDGRARRSCHSARIRPEMRPFATRPSTR